MLKFYAFIMLLTLDKTCVASDEIRPWHAAIKLILVSQKNPDCAINLEKFRNLINTKLPDDSTVLHQAIYYGNVFAAQWLIENGAKLTTQDSSGLTPLESCCIQNKYLAQIVGVNNFAQSEKISTILTQALHKKLKAKL